MNAKIASLAVGLVATGALFAGAPAFARPPGVPKSAAAKAAPAHRTAGTGKSARGAPLPAAYAAIPEAERRAVQADLVWLGHFEGMSAEEIDAHTFEALKAFQKRNNGKETGVLGDSERSLLAQAAAAPKAAVGWRLIDDSATGARLGVPEKLVPRAGAGRTGSRWTSAQGQIQIETFRLHEASLPALFEQEKKSSQRSVGFAVLDPDSFVIIGAQRLKKFVVRAQANGTELRGVTVLYDQATEGTMAPIAVAVSDTFVGFPDSNAASGHRRGVEYGSGLVVTSGGDLLAGADVTGDCQAITVPGHGHADRIAADKTADLALLRLYGAHDLVPAALADAGDGISGGLTLVGIADPLAQAGGNAVTKAAAQLNAQAVTPAPQPGFSGAPAIDAQGRFAGVVTLHAATIAGAGSAAPQAVLIPAATVRAFLAAHGIAGAAGTTAMEQAVVRLICIRK